MDTMTFTKSLGAICGSLLVFLLGGWAAESLYHTGGEVEQAYTIDTGEDDAPVEDPAEVPFMEVLAAATPEDGQSIFNQCRACHQLEEGVNGVGPHLYAVVGRDIASVEGFGYSDALAGLDGAWEPEALNGFLENPQGYAPGTIMGYAGLDDVEDRANLIAYLSTVGGEFTPPEVEQAAAQTGDADASDAAPAQSEETGTAQGEGADAAPAGETASDAGDDAAANAVDIAAGDPDAGEGVYRQCAACHRLEEGQNAVGPHLAGIVGRDIASVEGFDYSDALAGMDGAWTPENLDGFIENPMDYAPGTTMGYPGVRDDTDRLNLLAFLAQQGSGDSGDAAPEGDAEGDAAADDPAPEAATDEAAADEAAADEAATEAAETQQGAAGAGADAGDGGEAASDGGTGDGADAGAEAPSATDDDASGTQTAEAGDAEADAAAGAVQVAGDPAAGESVFRQCAACHRTQEGQNAVGPHLSGVVGRDIASVEGFNYSEALTSLDGTWTPEQLDGWLANPREFAPGNRMGYPGVRDATDRENLIAYLAMLGN